jgi:hypothetical protein
MDLKLASYDRVMGFPLKYYRVTDEVKVLNFS